MVMLGSSLGSHTHVVGKCSVTEWYHQPFKVLRSPLMIENFRYKSIAIQSTCHLAAALMSLCCCVTCMCLPSLTPLDDGNFQDGFFKSSFITNQVSWIAPCPVSSAVPRKSLMVFLTRFCVCKCCLHFFFHFRQTAWSCPSHERCNCLLCSLFCSVQHLWSVSLWTQVQCYLLSVAL